MIERRVGACDVREGEVRAGSELRYGQLDRAGARVPGALALAVAAVGAFRLALAVGGAAEGVDLGVHQRLGHALDHREYCDTMSLLC